MKKLLGKYAKKTAGDIIRMFPLVRDLRIGKAHGLFLNFIKLVCKMNPAASNCQADFIKISPCIGNRFSMDADIRIELEHIEMTYSIVKIFRNPIEFPFIKFLYGFHLTHLPQTY